jgi:hypothetical protein
MKNFLIATSTLICLMAAPLAAQAATASSQSSATSEPAQIHKHATVRHHMAQNTTSKHRTTMSQAKKNEACPPGSQNPACHPSTTGSVH